MKAGNERYARQMLLPEIDDRGQDLLGRASVAIVGLGGLGSPVALYLAAAGVGKLILIDQDPVEITNLNRQILHWEKDAAKHRSKVESAAKKIHAFNERTEIVQCSSSLTEQSVASLLDRADVIADCVDNFHARRVMNNYCVRNGKRLVHAAVEEWRGQVTTIVPGRTPCLSCIFEREPTRNGPIPILGAVAGAFGAIQAAEVVKVIIGSDDILTGRLLLGDLKTHSWDVVDVERRRGCPTCGHL